MGTSKRCWQGVSKVFRTSLYDASCFFPASETIKGKGILMVIQIAVLRIRTTSYVEKLFL